jgi:hypothetical protein
MPKFSVIFTRTTVETQEIEISAKDEDGAAEKAQAKIDDDKLKKTGWELEEELIEYEMQ